MDEKTENDELKIEINLPTSTSHSPTLSLRKHNTNNSDVIEHKIGDVEVMNPMQLLCAIHSFFVYWGTLRTFRNK